MIETDYKPTLLILGISSFVGSNLAKHFQNKYRVVGTYHTQPVVINGINSIPCDVTKKDMVIKVTQWVKPKYVIYCAGESSLMHCQSNPKVSELRNSTGVVNSLLASDRVGAKFIYLSSSFVHGGDQTFLREADTPLPETVYGHNISASEFYVQRSSVNYLVLRTCPLYGIGYGKNVKNIFEKILYNIKKEENLELDHVAKTGFLDVMIFAKMLENILDNKITNRLIQVSSKNVMSYFDFATKVANVFKLDERFLIRSSESFFNSVNKNKKNQAEFLFQMDVSNLEEIINAEVPTIDESLAYTRKNFKI